MTTPTTATRVFFSFPSVTDPARHPDYNDWHQLDHRPQNLALPGVLHGDRWVRSPECAALGSAPDPVLARAHYVAMYWFAEPADASIREWQALADTTIQQGRRQDLRWTTRPLMGFFRPIQGFAHPRVRITPDALPFRPNRGVYITVTEVDSPDGPDAAELFDWYARTRIPQVLAVDGVAGGWIFRSEDVTTEADDGTRTPVTSTLRITLYYLDGDPAEVTRRIDALEPLPHNDIERPLLSGPARTIEPWQWTWFE
ncbi:hypothetical protein [Actinokineospora sp. NBRC 105648]|uniref:hypothetical protein n=1 Tax=Actinokineospora sp. NBRC 105648 TaxID=3032206 RepID=UPI0024A46A44|nr:hypothetical protein [Actinokineospora sp. NBRC 105648]GLZ41994.1 hypothetical protein Acsp05_56180 [Actinokineospora sp. NBRC 105648]